MWRPTSSYGGLRSTTSNVSRWRYRPSRDRVSGKTILLPKPYFSLDGDGLRLHHVPVPRTRPNLNEDEACHYVDEQPALLKRMYGSLALRGVRGLVNRQLAGVKDRLRSLLYRAVGVQIYDDYLNPVE